MLIGHQRIWNFLTQSAAKNRLAHAYLFVGAPQVGKRTLATEFAKWLLCTNKAKRQPCGSCQSCRDFAKNQHPDFFILAPRQEEKRGVIKIFEIGLGEIKNLQHRLSLFSYSSFYKIAVIDGIESLTREAANSLLKTLEEPTKNTLIFLITSNWRAILPTIISRCQLIKFLPVPDTQILQGLRDLKINLPDPNRIIRLCLNRPGRSIELVNNPEIIKNSQENAEFFKKFFKADLNWRWDLARQISQDAVACRDFLSQWLLWLRDRLLENRGLSGLALGQSISGKISFGEQRMLNLMKEIMLTQAIINDPSFNSRLALELLMLKI